MSLFLHRPPSAQPSDHKKLYLTLPLSEVQRPTWGQSSSDVYTLGQNSLPNSFDRKIISMFLVTINTPHLGDPRPYQGAPSGGRRAEGGGRTTKGRGGQRTADGRKFLLLFSNTLE